MNNTLLKKMNFSVLSFYALMFIFTISALLFSMPINIIRVSIFFIFVSDIYFIITYYSSKKEKAELNTKSLEFFKVKGFFILENLITVVPFFITVLTLLIVFNIVSFNMIVSKNIDTLNFFTYTYPNLFFIYIIRIGQFFYSFAKKCNTKFIASICSKVTLLAFLLITIVFFLAYNNLNSRVVSKVFTTQNQFIEELTYSTSIYLSEYLEDRYSDEERNQIFSDFAATNNVKEIMLRVGNSLYQTNDNREFLAKHFIFDMLILKSEEFILTLSGKNFSRVIYITVLAFIIIASILLFPVILLSRMLLQKTVANAVDIMVEGLNVKSSNIAIDTSDMEKSEMLELCKGYNDIYLAMKYRDLYMNDVQKRDVEDE